MIHPRILKRYPRRPVLCLMVKYPVAGSVKTRLAREIGPPAALGFYRQSTGKLIRSLAADSRWRVVLCITPDSACAARSVCWPPHIGRFAQGTGSLGARMRRVFDQYRNGPCVIIGSDAPQISPAHIARAFEALRHTDFVLGPAPDGGYWLIGYRAHRALPRSLFANVRWSSAYALKDTCNSIPADYSTGYIDRLHDVDHAADLPYARDHLLISPRRYRD